MSIVDYRVVEGRVDLDPQAQEFLGASELLCILRVRALIKEGWTTMGKPQALNRNRAAQVMVLRVDDASGKQVQEDWDLPVTICGVVFSSPSAIIADFFERHSITNDAARRDTIAYVRELDRRSASRRGVE